MLTDDGKHLYISWNEYHSLIERLALKVHESGWQFDQILCLARGELSGRVLLVDDLADSGVTLAAVAERLRGLPAISELRSAVLWTKAISTYTPDYFVEVLPTSPWIHQPFEDYDDISIETLIKRNAQE